MIEVIIPGEAPSTPNLREHWAAKAKRTKAQRAKVMAKMPAWARGPLLIVRLTRVAPRALDSDNLAGALKGHRDAVAARLRVDDASPLVRWEYHQAKGAPAVVVNAWRAGDVAPEYIREMEAAPTRVKGTLNPGANSGGKRLPEPAYSPPPVGLGSEVMREMLEPPGKEDYRAAVLRVLDAEDRALSAAQLAEETCAPGTVPPCGHCGDEYRPTSFDPKAPPGSVKCRKDVHCYRFDGHDGECSSRSPLACTT